MTTFREQLEGEVLENCREAIRDAAQWCREYRSEQIATLQRTPPTERQRRFECVSAVWTSWRHERALRAWVADGQDTDASREALAWVIDTIDDRPDRVSE